MSGVLGLKCVIIAVHGTWAPYSPWTREDSVLSRELKASLGEETVFKSFSWSGSNSHASRLRASEDLCEFIKCSVRDLPGIRHLIVAHSHGGNVALYAMRDACVRSRVDGLVCIGTPFLSCTKRNARQFLRLMSFMFPIGLWILPASPLLGLETVIFELRISDAPSWMTVGAAFLLLGPVFYFVHRFIRGELTRYVEGVQECLVRERTLPAFDDVPVLVVRHAWDEALVALASLGKLAEIPYFLLHVIGLLAAGKWLGQTWARVVGGFLFGAIVVVLGLQNLASGKLYGFFSYLVLAVTIGLMSMVSGLTWIWFVPRLAATRLAYGESDGLHWVYVRSIAEPLPPVKHEVSKARAEGLVFAHSWLHSNKVVAKAIATWAKATLVGANATERSPQPRMTTPSTRVDKERGCDSSSLRAQEHPARTAALSALGISYLAGGVAALLTLLFVSVQIRFFQQHWVQIWSITDILGILGLALPLAVVVAAILALRRSLRDGSGTARYWMLILVAGMSIFFILLVAGFVWGIVVSIPTLPGTIVRFAVLTVWLITAYMICLVPALLVRSYWMHRVALSSLREPVLGDVLGFRIE